MKTAPSAQSPTTTRAAAKAPAATSQESKAANRRTFDLTGKSPIYLPTATVDLLRDLCEAAGIHEGAEGFAGVFLGELIQDSLKSERHPDDSPGFGLHGVPALIPDLWSLGDDEAECIEAMLAVVDRWKEKGEGA